MGWWPCRATWQCDRKRAVGEKLQNQRLEWRGECRETAVNHNGNTVTWVRYIVLQIGLFRAPNLLLL